MKPWRAALTSATASGKSTRIASRKAIACSSAPPGTCIRLSAAAVRSTAVFSVRVANCSRCASATDSACCSANSRRLRIRSSGLPPNGKLKPPSSSMKKSLADDHHGAACVPGDAVGKRPEQVVAQEMALVAEHDQVCIDLAGVADDQLCGVTRAKLDLGRDTGSPRPPLA